MGTVILGIESSCDDTSAAVVRDRQLLSNVIAGQDVHRQYGGVVPELASRAHQQNIVPVVDRALKEAGVSEQVKIIVGGAPVSDEFAREIGADAFGFDAAVKSLNCRMAEYTKAVLDGRPHFHISLVVDVSPNCDCHGENDVPILPDLGMFASFDPLALDQACVDACLKADPLPGSQLADNMANTDFVDHHDHFANNRPGSEWRTCLSHAEKIGLGTREYALIRINWRIQFRSATPVGEQEASRVGR